MMRVIAGVSYSYRNQLRRLTIMLHVSNYPCFSTYIAEGLAQWLRSLPPNPEVPG